MKEKLSTDILAAWIEDHLKSEAFNPDNSSHCFDGDIRSFQKSSSTLEFLVAMKFNSKEQLFSILFYFVEDHQIDFFSFMLKDSHKLAALIRKYLDKRLFKIEIEELDEGAKFFSASTSA
eukprot:GHVP01071180.1.p1 GENE.GHVP01071180.1~~GHVP01071180.1.p1  ORF type:complete len:120 (-),score=26.35 GHVP01071180.1:154-513(-)